MHTKQVYTTKMSSKGQVVIPEALREALGLSAGTQFVVVGRGDTVIFKLIEEPKMAQFDALISEARKYAKKAGLKSADVKNAIRKARDTK